MVPPRGAADAAPPADRILVGAVSGHGAFSSGVGRLNRETVSDSGDKAAQETASGFITRSRTRHDHMIDRCFQGATLFFALLVLALLAAILGSLVVGAWPALIKFGLGFLASTQWNPVTGEFGALVPIAGTLTTSLIALTLAVPVSFGIAIFLTELCTPPLRRPLGTMIELLAGIPSIIYGMWGLFVLAPFLSTYVQPALTRVFGPLPLIGALFQGPPIGIGIFPASVVLAVMIIPFITAVMRDVFEVVPSVLKESAYGLGATTSEVMWRIVLPYTKTGVVGGIMLGLGRALGETMAVTFVIGNANRISVSLYESGNSIASMLANEFAEATHEIHTASLIALGLVLFFITLIVLTIAKLLLIRLVKRQGTGY
jgi:phosphate transport system permease protein